MALFSELRGIFIVIYLLSVSGLLIGCSKTPEQSGAEKNAGISEINVAAVRYKELHNALNEYKELSSVPEGSETPAQKDRRIACRKKMVGIAADLESVCYAILSGEKSFDLTAHQQHDLREYLRFAQTTLREYQ